MAHIVAAGVRKTFRVYAQRSGDGGKRRFGRTRRDVVALDGIDFRIDRGELVGYIGPNGAGKSTTIKILSGILVPDSGEVLVADRVPWKQRIEHVRQIGVVFGQRTQLWWDLPVIESFELLQHIYRIDPERYRKNLDELTELLDLSPLLSVPVRQLSLGQRMRCDIAASLLHDPDLLFLDEPTIGLDAVAKLAVRDFVQRVNEQKRITVVLTTHDMDDIETLCRRVIVIGAGRILSDGPLSELRDSVSSLRRLIIDFSADPGDLGRYGATVVERNELHVVLEFDPNVVPSDRLVSAIAADHRIRDLFVENPPIERIIAKYYDTVQSDE